MYLTSFHPVSRFYFERITSIIHLHSSYVIYMVDILICIDDVYSFFQIAKSFQKA